jgi:hypothetical protein
MSWLDGAIGSQERILSVLRRDNGPIVCHGSGAFQTRNPALLTRRTDVTRFYS